MSEETKEIIEKTFQVDKNSRLRIKNIHGSVDVRPGSEKVIKIIANKFGARSNAEKTEIVINQQDDGSVTARVVADNNSFFDLFTNFRVPCKVRFVIETPPDCKISLQNISSSATLTGLKGDMKLKTVSGALNLIELSGKLDVGSVSGVITGQKISGESEIDSVSGKIDLRGCNFPSLESSSVSGRTIVETSVNEGPYAFKSVSGEVTLIVGSEAQCSVSTTSLSGRFKTSLPAHDYYSKAGKTKIEINGGGSLVRMQSVSGNLIILDSRGDTPHVPVTGIQTRKDRIAILTQLGDGDLSVGEALTILV